MGVTSKKEGVMRKTVHIFLFIVALLLMSYFVSAQREQETPSKVKIKIQKSQEEWKQLLSEEQYQILRQKGTEAPFSGDYWNNKEEGVYYCLGCNNPLFLSTAKYVSGTGWPSFYQPATDTSVVERLDKSYGWNRTEIICAKCDGHLGHVFTDGPKPTGLRYCINATVLKFKMLSSKQ